MLLLFGIKINQLVTFILPQNRWPDARSKTFSELNQWLKSHTNNNSPTVLVGDFNMPFEKKKLKKYIFQYIFYDWTITKLIYLMIILPLCQRFKVFHVSCIDHIIYNKKKTIIGLIKIIYLQFI